MSRIVVVGAGGRTGQLVTAQLIKAGHAVVATIRSAKHLPAMVKLGAETVMIDLDQSPLVEFERAFKGADAIVFAAGSATGESSAIDRKGTVRSIHAAEKVGVKRFVTIASIGASTGMKLAGAWATDEMRDYYKQKRLANKALQASALDWTILEPGELTEGKGTGKITLSQAAMDAARPLPRADLAATIVAVLSNRKTSGKTFQMGAGKIAIDEAVKAAV
jgi:uncharacterized protein YbjT (DUF2867 family)